MEGKVWWKAILVLILFFTVLFVEGGVAHADPDSGPLGTEFTYQGYLEISGEPANGTYYLGFKLWSDPTGGIERASMLPMSVPVTDGYFTAELDFGENIFTGHVHWLEISVGSSLLSMTTLSPREPLMASPYALYARRIPLEGDGTSNKAARGDHIHFGETWHSSGDLGFRVVNDRTTDNSIALAGIAQASIGAVVGVYGQAESQAGFAGSFKNASNGVAISAINYGTKPTMVLRNEGVDGLTLELQNNGIGPDGTDGGDFIVATNATGQDVQFRVATDGEVFSDKGYNCGKEIQNAFLPPTYWALTEVSIDPCLSDDSPADFAEMLPGEGEIDVGEVLVISPDGSLVLSSEAYQTTVVGVHSTRPSYLGNAQFADVEGYVPLAMLGVVPVKASAENGPIQPGDMLVSSDTPGHAMRAGENPPQGTVIGKALSPLEEGTDYIQMIVTLQ